VNGAVQRLTRRPDLAIALILLVLGEVEAVLLAPDAPSFRQAALTLLWCVPLIWRRRWPVPVLAVVTFLGPAIPLVNEQGGINSYALAAILAAYTVGRELEPPRSWWGPGLTVGYNWVFLVMLGGSLSDFVFITLLYGGAWVVGQVIRRRDLKAEAFALEAGELRRTQAERERKAVTQERGRIARELHDIVSHSISVITIQTQAVRRRLGPENDAEIEDLRVIENTAREAMTEMRRLLGALRADGDTAPLSPQPGIGQLERLVSETSAVGVPVDLRIVGDPKPLPPGVDVTAYRIVQEALTNVRKHAAGARTAVVVSYSPECIELQIENEGRGLRETPSGGNGLIGMRERVALYGGTLEAGHREKSFQVKATLPLRSTEASA
jgi:signal transduction histidine kinase